MRSARARVVVFLLLALGAHVSGQSRGQRGSQGRASSTPPSRASDIDRASAGKLLQAAALRGESFRVNANGRIELVPVNVRQLHTQPIDQGRVRASVDYSLFENHGRSVELRVTALQNSQPVAAVAAKPVPAHPGIGTAIYTLQVAPEQQATTTALRFEFYAPTEQRVFYSKDFPFAKRWTFEQPRRPAVALKPTLAFVRVKASELDALELDLFCAAGAKADTAVLTGQALDRQKSPAAGVTFSTSSRPGAGGICTIRFAFAGEKPVRTQSVSIKMMSGRVELASLDLPVAKTWLEDAASTGPSVKTVKGTLVKNLYPDNWEVKGEDGKLYFVYFNNRSDYEGYDPGDEVHVGGRAVDYAAGTSLNDAWHVGEGYTVAGTVSAVACGGQHPRVSVRQTGTNKEYQCRFSDAETCGTFAVYDMVEVNGNIRPVGSTTLRNSNVRYHYHPTPRTLTKLTQEDYDSGSLLGYTGFDILAQVHTSLLQAYITSYYAANQARFRTGSLSVDEPVLTLWNQGMNRPGFRLTVHDGAVSATVDMAFTLRADAEKIRLDFAAGAATVHAGPSGSGASADLGGLLQRTAALFQNLRAIDIPLGLITSFFPATRIPISNGTEKSLSQIEDVEIQVRATDQQGTGYVFIGLSYHLPTSPPRGFNYFINGFYYDFSKGQTIAIDVCQEIMTGLALKLFEPVKTFPIEPPVRVSGAVEVLAPAPLPVPVDVAYDFKVSLGILDSFDATLEGVTLKLREALVDFYELDIPLLPDCGEWEFGTQSRPTLTSPGRPGSRCHTHGARLEGWQVTFAVTQENGKAKFGIGSMTAGKLIDRGMLGLDFTGAVDASMFAGVGLLVPEFPLPGTSKKIAAINIGGARTETYFWFGMR